MSDIEQYVRAATRENTRGSYRSAIEHYEVAWGGLLPATADGIARYLAAYADSLAVTTLQQRLAALGQWHLEHGFADPTKAPLVRKVLRGIRQLHPHRPKQAHPVQLALLEKIDATLASAIGSAQDAGQAHRARRDRALVLLGFWRAFRSDELCRLRVEDICAHGDKGLKIFLHASKTDREGRGKTYQCPALSRLCPARAYNAWVESAGLVRGPVFRRIDRWGHIGETGLHPNSVVPLLRTIIDQSGVSRDSSYSSHSLRRGFATWANADGWDMKALMDYVGWRDLKSALRYIDVASRFNSMLASGDQVALDRDEL